jgi:hypothetical protein
MTVSFTPCCAKPDAAARWLLWLLLVGVLAFALPALAADKTAVRQAAIRAVPQGYVLDAETDIVLNRTLEDALGRGINLYFRFELELSRPINWWLDDAIAEPERKLRIYYHLLLRRYVVESGYVTRTTATLGEALSLLGRIKDWQVLERGALVPGRRYDARLRLRLDTTQLPKALAIGGASDQWELASPWHSWAFDAPALPAPPTPP